MRGGSENRVPRELRPCQQVVILRDRQPLLRLSVANTGVDNPRAAVARQDGAARVDVRLALVFGWAQSDRQVLPIHQVAAAGVSPVHVPPERTVRIELVEEMVPAAVKDGSIRIVVPVGRRMEVISGSLWIRGHGGNC